MLRRHSSETTKKKSLFARFTRSFVSITIISVFVFSISYGMKFLSEKNPQLVFYDYSRRIPADSKVGQVAGMLTKGYEKYNSEVVNRQEIAAAVEEEVPQENNAEASDTSTSTGISTDEQDIANKTEADNITIAIFADSHNDSSNLKASLILAQNQEVDAIIHTGDVTDLGLIADLEAAKQELDLSSVPYYVIPGDRDLWETTGPENFIKVFGDNKHAFKLGDVKFVVFDNSRNFSRVPESDFTWFKSEVTDADFVILSQPLYHPSNKVMGNSDGENILTVREQADAMLELVRSSNVKAVIAGDHHLSSENIDPQKESLMHYVVGAVTKTINDKPQSLLQTSRFSILRVRADGSYTMTEQLL